MVQLVIGYKPGFGPVVAVLRNDDDDFTQVPVTDYSKFFLSTEGQDLSYIFDKNYFSNGFNPSIYPATAPNTSNYVLQGASISTASRALSSRYFSSTSHSFKYYEIFSRFPDLGGMVPIFEAKLIDPNDRVKLFDFNGAQGNQQLFSIGVNYNSVNVYADVQVSNSDATILQYDRIAADVGFTGWCGQISNYTGPNNTYMLTGGTIPVMRALTCQWELPANNAPIPFPNSTPIAGQEVVSISPAGFKVARRGETVNSPNRRSFLINSDLSPMMCIMMGTTPIIPAGGTYYFANTSPLSLHPTMFLDAIMRYDGYDYSIPPVDPNVSRSGRECRFYYKIDTNGITFYNEGDYAVGCKFMVYATSTAGQTSGGVEIMRRVAGNHVQLKRPGSNDVSPSSNDILLDTRFPSVRIIKEGWIPISDFSTGNSLNSLYGTHAAVVPFTNHSGLFIFPKVVGNWPKMMAQGYYRSLRPGNIVSWRTSNHCMTTVVRANDMVIHMSPGAPTDVRADTGWQYTMPDPVGVRYYILGATTL